MNKPSVLPVATSVQYNLGNNQDCRVYVVLRIYVIRERGGIHRLYRYYFGRDLHDLNHGTVTVRHAL